MQASKQASKQAGKQKAERIAAQRRNACPTIQGLFASTVSFYYTSCPWLDP
jgi:hypothetical protein